jgi:putative membrane protein
MVGFILRLLIVALGLWLASEWVPGIEVKGLGTLFGAALMLGIVNAIVRPLLVILTLPITVLTLGLFLLVINAGMLGLVAWLFDNFTIADFGSALLGSVASYFIGPRGRIEVIVVRHRR